jgi:hypothetical protein
MLLAGGSHFPVANTATVKRSGTILAIMMAAFLLAGLLSPYRHGHLVQSVDRALGISDFGAFYCAALVHRAGADPYLLDGMKACEIARVYGPSGASCAEHGGVDPAPLPPYSLALFAPFTYLPYRDAGLLWLGLLVAATFGGAFALTRLTGHPYWITLAFLWTGAAGSFAFGQPQPFLTLGLIVSALLLRSGRDAWAAVTLTVTLIDPHVGIAPLLGMLVWSRARTTVILIFAGAGLLSFAYGGVALNLEYLTKVLPVAAFSELTVAIQLGLSSLLSALGASDDWALRLGALQYGVLLVATVLAAGPLSRRIGRPAIVLVPAAGAVFGGVYIHVTQLASALPLAFYLIATVPSGAVLAWTGAALITLPWPASIGGPLGLPAKFAILYVAAAGSLAGRSRNLQTTAAVAAIALYFLSGPPMRHLSRAPIHRLEPVSTIAVRGYDPALVSTQAAVEARADQAANGATVYDLVARMPYWIGLALILGAAFFVSARRPENLAPRPGS